MSTSAKNNTKAEIPKINLSFGLRHSLFVLRGEQGELLAPGTSQLPQEKAPWKDPSALSLTLTSNLTELLQVTEILNSPVHPLEKLTKKQQELSQG